MRVLSGFVAWAVLFTAMPSSAQVQTGGIVDGNKLYSLCTTTGSTGAAMECLGYVQGATDATLSFEDRDGKQRVCLAAGVTSGQLRDITVKYLRDMPEMRHHLAADLVLVALATAFPCQK